MISKWLFFDVGSTLVDETEAYNHRIRDMIAGTDVTFEQFTEKRLHFAKQNLRGDIEAMNHFGLKKTPWHFEDEIPYPETHAVLKYLVSKGYKIGVIANQALGTEDRLRNWGLMEFISIVAASAELGVAKPNKEIFLRAFEMAGCTSENSVMIGDRLDNDIYPAIELGMKTVWVRQGFSMYQQLDSAKPQPHFIIDCIADMTSIF